MGAIQPPGMLDQLDTQVSFFKTEKLSVMAESNMLQVHACGNRLQKGLGKDQEKCLTDVGFKFPPPPRYQLSDFKVPLNLGASGICRPSYPTVKPLTNIILFKIQTFKLNIIKEKHCLNEIINI